MSAARRLELGLALISAAVVLLELVQTRIFSFMLWHHLTYLVVTFALLGFAAGGSLVACLKPTDAAGLRRRLTLWAAAFGLSTLAAFLIVTRLIPSPVHSAGQIAVAGLRYAVVMLPLVFAGMVVAQVLAVSRGQAGRRYAFNLAGSALGGALMVPLLPILGGGGCVLLVAAMGFGAAACFASRPRGLALLAVGLVASSLVGGDDWLEIPVAPNKSMGILMAHDRSLRIEQTRWTPTCRVDVVGPGPSDPSRTRTLYQDGDSPTQMSMAAGAAPENPYAVSSLAYLAFEERAPRVLVFGVGGGADIQQALAPRSFADGSEVAFTGVEVNTGIIELMRGEYREATGDRYAAEGVEVVAAEGRSWLERTDATYDLIQLSGTDTYVALSSGSYVMAESFLYTREAFQSYLDHLSDDGVLAIWRLRFDPPRETLRLCALAVDALRGQGVEEPARHALVMGVGGPRVLLEERETGLDFGILLLKKQPFTERELARYREFANFSPEAQILHDPQRGGAGAFGAFFDAVRSGSEQSFAQDYRYDLSVPTDDRPFFFRFHRWKHLGSDSNSAAPGMVGDFFRVIGEEPVGLRLMSTVLVECAVLILVLVFAPLFLLRRRGLRVRAVSARLFHFAGLGAGFMMVEMVCMQRFVLYLGHPVYSLSVVLVVFLAGAALGAALVQRFGASTRLRVVGLACVLAGLLVVHYGTTPLFAATLGQPFGLRVVVSVLALLPLSVAMGLPFAAALESLPAREEALVPWAFAVNGSAAVLASVLGILVAMSAGFSGALAAASLAYLVALLTVRRTAST